MLFKNNWFISRPVISNLKSDRIRNGHLHSQIWVNFAKLCRTRSTIIVLQRQIKEKCRYDIADAKLEISLQYLIGLIDKRCWIDRLKICIYLYLLKNIIETIESKHTHPSIHPSIHPFINHSIYLSIYLSV